MGDDGIEGDLAVYMTMEGMKFLQKVMKPSQGVK